MDLKTKNIGKSFSGVNVLRKVDFDLKPGEVHALVGENGAGKSTFVKILSGVYTPTDGDIFLDQNKVDITSPIIAQNNGVSLIHQEPQSFSHLSVAENIFMGHMEGNNFSRVKWQDINKKSNEILNSIGLKIDPKIIMEGLSIADQQMIEIAGALSKNSKILIMDEPTSPLTPNEVGKLFEIVNKLKSNGMAIIFISHRLEEIRQISDRVTIFRDGDLITTKKINEVSNEEIIKFMIGRNIEETEIKNNEFLKNDDYILNVKNLSLSKKFSDISFNLKKGEILGFAGLVGAGRTEVAKSIFGAEKFDNGEIIYNGQKIINNSPNEAIKKGFAYVPEDRKQMGIFGPVAVEDNVTSAVPKDISNNIGLINSKIVSSITNDYIKRFNIILTSGRQLIEELSGGNQQKCIISKWLLSKPKVLILDEPTRGVDVGVKSEMYEIINQLANDGTAIILISSELPEILSLSHRIIVMREGKITKILNNKDATQENIMSYAIN
ncbi:MAG: D-xylose ABC transporter ATP-binding protein [Candidatus Marinimicrobia bacterium]|nr:D-xylose ABC transporter ATP-binding protein [Candidatus Neomarinimicrobiota bacterium]|tara:strand:+ start:1369 stop:2853 length:1485 start_codon:yes stop_codon:yes gene_type:complete